MWNVGSMKAFIGSKAGLGLETLSKRICWVDKDTDEHAKAKSLEPGIIFWGICVYNLQMR